MYTLTRDKSPQGIIYYYVTGRASNKDLEEYWKTQYPSIKTYAYTTEILENGDTRIKVFQTR